MAPKEITLEINLSIATIGEFAKLEEEYFAILYNLTAGNIYEMTRVSKISRATIYRKLIHHYGDNFREVLK